VEIQRKPSADELNLTAATWRKARRSDNQGACVRVAHHGGHVLLDDSKNPAPTSGNALVITPAEFRAFLNTVLTN
jgi:hypothetical protein